MSVDRREDQKESGGGGEGTGGKGSQGPVGKQGVSAPGPGPQMPDEIAAARMVSGRVEFLLSAPQLKFLPEPTVPEVALAGRSNVGKSSLINALTGRKGLARASNTPGRTQEINFFTMGNHGYLVDLPGYGFANAGGVILMRDAEGRPVCRHRPEASLEAMIEAQRAYEISSKMVSAVDEMLRNANQTL